MAEVHLICAKCHAPLTRRCRIGAASDRTEGALDGEPVVPAGVIVRLEAEASRKVQWPNGEQAMQLVSQAGAYSVCPEDVIDGVLRSSGVDNGCCGSDGCDGPNRSCICGQVVATQWSDCWTQAEVRFEPDAVELAD